MDGHAKMKMCATIGEIMCAEERSSLDIAFHYDAVLAERDAILIANLPTVAIRKCAIKVIHVTIAK